MGTMQINRARGWVLFAGCVVSIGLINPISAEAAPRGRVRVAAGPVYVGAHPYLAPSAVYVAPYRVPPRAVVVPSPWYAVPPVRVYREPFFYPNAIWGPAPYLIPEQPHSGPSASGEPTPAAPPSGEVEPVPAPPALPVPTEPPLGQ